MDEGCEPHGSLYTFDPVSCNQPWHGFAATIGHDTVHMQLATGFDFLRNSVKALNSLNVTLAYVFKWQPAAVVIPFKQTYRCNLE